MEYYFQAGLLRLEADQKRAVFYLMNTSRNRNRWGVTDRSLEEGLPSIKGKPLGCGRGYKLGHHKPENTLDVGSFTDYVKTGSYALGLAEVTDDEVLRKLMKGEWGPISVVVKAYQSHCSKCEADTSREGFEHSCVKKGSGYVVVESFAFTRVDFVDDPAYPQAGLQEILAEAKRAAEQPITLLAGYYTGDDSQSTEDRAEGPGAPPHGGSKPEENKAENMTTKTVEELQKELGTAEAEITQLKGELQAANVKAQDVTELRRELDAQRAERHQAEVDAAAEARVKAGLTKDLAAEKLRIKDLSDHALRELKASAEEVLRVRGEAAKPTGPKARYDTKEEVDAFAAAVNRRKADLALGLFKEVK